MLREKLPESLIPALLDGRVVPKNGRVLCKAVTWQQTSEMVEKVARIRGLPVEDVAKEMGVDLSAATGGQHIREAPYHEIVAVAADVDDPDIRPGALCRFVSAAADFAHDKRYVYVKAHHIIACEAL